MQLIALLASAATAIAAALPQATYATTYTNFIPENYTWEVTRWHAGCARAGCSYNFNVTGTITSPYPGFKAYCSGYDTGYYDECEILEGVSTSGIPFVAASLRPNFYNGIATMSVSLSFTDADSLITYNASGWYDASYNAFVAPLQNFTITPTQLTLVA